MNDILIDLHRHGKQGPLDSASNQILDSEFGTSNEEEVIKQIIEKGTIYETEVCFFSPLPSPSSLPPFPPQYNTNNSLGNRPTRSQERQHGFPLRPLDASPVLRGACTIENIPHREEWKGYDTCIAEHRLVTVFKFLR